MKRIIQFIVTIIILFQANNLLGQATSNKGLYLSNINTLYTHVPNPIDFISLENEIIEPQISDTSLAYIFEEDEQYYILPHDTGIIEVSLYSIHSNKKELVDKQSFKIKYLPVPNAYINNKNNEITRQELMTGCKISIDFNIEFNIDYKVIKNQIAFNVGGYSLPAFKSFSDTINTLGFKQFPMAIHPGARIIVSNILVQLTKSKEIISTNYIRIIIVNKNDEFQHPD